MFRNRNAARTVQNAWVPQRNITEDCIPPICDIANNCSHYFEVLMESAPWLLHGCFITHMRFDSYNSTHSHTRVCIHIHTHMCAHTYTHTHTQFYKDYTYAPTVIYNSMHILYNLTYKYSFGLVLIIVHSIHNVTR